ncbi:MAG: HAMP domain-containing histidine kinase [Rhodothermales bacterium]|nr:HAMP domain-containing histidine kinase [Rhodothermales bacterium]
MSTGRGLAGLVFPSRASTQTWMILTFVLFVGIAVVAVGLYVTFVVGSEIQSTIRQTLYQQTVRMAERVEDASPEDRERVVAEVARLTDLRITVVLSDGGIIDYDGRRPVEVSGVLTAPEVAGLTDGEARYEQRIEGSQSMLFAAMHRPASGMIVRVGQIRPPLIILLERMRAALIVAMVMALILTLLGSWIAAKRVTQPLESIRRSARSISEGDLDEPILVDSRASEFQDLADSLNKMTETYRDQIVELKRMAALQNEFIGNVSHEVRNPIFSVGGYLEALASASLTDQQRKFYAEKGLTNLERLNNLFNDLIEIARLEYREDLIRTEPFDLQELVDEIAEQLAPKAHEKGLELIASNPRHFVRADRARIRQVLINLVDNAIAYSDEGTVRCRFRRHLDKVRIEVVDTGRGIPEDHLEHIFERFYRVDPDRSRKSGGTGLGLSIVKQILHAHGEPVHVESTAGRSTRFWFELPYVSQEEEA